MSDIVTMNNDGFADDAADNAKRVIRGTLLKYSKNLWTLGQDKLPAPRDFRAVAIETRAAWVKWQDGKPVDYIWRILGRPLPGEDELPDQDQKLWERDEKGEPKRPWQNTRFLHLIEPSTFEAFTFSTQSFGGRMAVGELSDRIQLTRIARPGARPIITLGTSSYVVSSRRHLGQIPRPLFTIVGWVGGQPKDEASPMVPKEIVKPSAPSPAKVPATPSMHGDDMNDEIPW
jgi:hypothetical protein